MWWRQQLQQYLPYSFGQVAVCNLAGHPTQQHLVAAGGEDGTLALWDMRNTAHPFTIIAAHNGPGKKILSGLTQYTSHPWKLVFKVKLSDILNLSLAQFVSQSREVK